LTDEIKFEKMRVSTDFWVVVKRKERDFYCE
jgi:hypothetical protein